VLDITARAACDAATAAKRLFLFGFLFLEGLVGFHAQPNPIKGSLIWFRR
jgi:hypothetical protein